MDGYSTLAQGVALAVGDVHACLVLSRDGMVIGAYPEDDESLAKPAWVRFAALGVAQRGFVEFPDQIWAFVHRGPYSCFALAAPSARPGLLMDQMEQALLSAEEGRARREPRTLPEAGLAASGKPRSPLHPQLDRPAPETPHVVARATSDRPDEERRRQVPEQPAVVDAPGSEASPTERRDEEPHPPDEPRGDGAEAEAPASEPHDQEGPEVDRVLLAKEFYGLLQVQDGVDEGSS